MIAWLVQLLHSRDFWINFTSAVALLVVGKVGLLVGSLVRQLRASRQAYTVAGYWIGECSLPSYDGKTWVELWQFVLHGERVTLRFFAYSPSDRLIDRCVGSGVFRGGVLSAVYMSTGRSSYESGAMTLRLKNLRLVGAYTQFDFGSPDETLFHCDDFTLARVRLGLIQKLKFFIGLSPIRRFVDAKRLLGDALAQREWLHGAEETLPQITDHSGK